MSSSEKAAGQLLTLHDVREYLIDTNALKEAEGLLVADDGAKDANRDGAYNDSKTKALGTSATTGGDRMAYMRRRAQKSKADRKEEILDNLTGLGPQGKLNILREEEEMKELLNVEAALRDESITLERERMNMAAQAEGAKRSNLKKLERDMEQEMMQLELQRNIANKELDKKIAAIEALASDLHEVEADMDRQVGPEAQKARAAKEGVDQGEENKKDHMSHMFDLVKNHANNMVESTGKRVEAEDELQRLSAAQGNVSAGVTRAVPLESIINTRKLQEEGEARDLTKVLPGGLVADLRESASMSEDAKKAASLLSQMGKTVGLESQQARLESLKQQALAEEKDLKGNEEFDVTSIDGSQKGADSVSVSSSTSGPSMKQGKSLHDSLDAWLNDVPSALASDGGSSAATAPTNGGAREPGVAFSEGSRVDSGSSKSTSKGIGAGDESVTRLAPPPSTKASAVGSGGRYTSPASTAAPAQSRSEFTAEMKESEQNDSLVQELMNEVKRMKEEREVREQQVKEQMRRQQEQYQLQMQQFQQQQGQVPYSATALPASAGGIMPAPIPAAPAIDPAMQAMLMQMQKFSEQMDRENQAMMQQLQGGVNMGGMGGMEGQYSGMQGQGGSNYNQPGDPRGINNPAYAYGNPLRRSGGNMMGGGYGVGREQALQAFHDRANRDGMGVDQGELHIPLHRKIQHKMEVKYDEEIRILDLEMDKVRKQVELDDFKYEASKVQNQRRAEDEHDQWLEEQKKELQALKMKQALAKEQRILNMQLDQLGGGGEDRGGDVQRQGQLPAIGAFDTEEKDLISMEEAGVGSVPIPFDLAAGVSCLVDGLLLPEASTVENRLGTVLENITDSSVFRIAIGIYTGDGSTVTRLAKSNWQAFKATTVGAQDPVPGLQAAPVDGKDNDVAGAGGNKDLSRLPNQQMAADWVSGVPVKRAYKRAEGSLTPDLRLLVEVQFAPSRADSEDPSSLGWGIFPLAGTEQGPMGRPIPMNGQHEPGDIYLKNGFYRVNIRKGLSDATADPTTKPNPPDFDGNFGSFELPYYENAWILLRVGDTVETQRQYAWIPEHHSHQLSTISDVKRVYKDWIGPESRPESTEVQLEAAPNASSKRASQKGRGKEQAQAQAQALEASEPKAKVQSQKSASRPQTGRSNAESTKGDDNGQVESAGLEPLPEEEEDTETAQQASDYEKKRDNIGKAKPQVPWMLGVDPGPATEKYQKGDGVDVYIDGAMYLPDNTTVSRVKIAFFTNEKEPCGPVSECFSDLEAVALSPSYHHKVELRGSSLNATATCLLRFDTIDSCSRKPASIGYSCFKIFCTKDREQPDSNNNPSTYINTGLFQLPVHAGRVPSLETFSDKMLDTLPRIPCASVMVRLKAAPHSKDGLSVLSCEDAPEAEWEALGLSSPAPAYMSGAYYGKLCEPTELEAFCFTAKATALTATVDSTLNQVFASAKSGDKVEYPPRPDVTGKKGGKEEQLVKDWTKSLLPPHKDMKKVLDYQFIAPYSLDSGLNVSIDGLYNMPESVSSFFSTPPVTVHKVIYSIVPPGLYYKDPPMSEGVFFSKTEDYKRSYRMPSFNDGFVHLFPPILDDGTYLMIEVKSITVEAPKGGGEPILTVDDGKDADKCWWALLPISAQATRDGDFKYLEQGVFQLPLIKGKPPAIDLFESEAQEPLELMMERLGPKGKAQASGKKSGLGNALKLSDGASVLVRVCNPFFRDCLDFPKLEPNDIDPDNKVSINTSMLDSIVSVAAKGVSGPIATPGNFKFEPKKFAVLTAKNMSIKERLQGLNIVDLKKFSKSVNKAFATAANINMD